MPATAPEFDVSLASSQADIEAAQRLRYDVFVAEMGATGPDIDHAARREADPFDPHAHHLILRDCMRDPASQVVGVYRLLTATQAAKAGGFSCEAEYDLRTLTGSGRNILELSRSCVHPDYRGGSAMFHLWKSLADYITQHDIELLFGVASFHGTDVAQHGQALALLFEKHLSPFKVSSRAPVPLATTGYDRKSAVQQMPALIKAYLRLGGAVGQGVYVDHAFGTTDVCMILDTQAMNARQKVIYAR